MKSKFLRFFWVFLLVVAAFTLGYTLKPGGERARPFGPAAMAGNGFAPPLDLGGRR